MKKLFNLTVTVLMTLLIVGCTKDNSIVKEFKNLDKNLKYEEPLGIDSIKLMKNGKVTITPNDKNIAEGKITVISDVKDMYIFTYGNGGYRTILFIKNDGSISAINTTSLIENKKIEILNNLGNYTNIVSIKQEKDQEGMLINAIDKSGKEYMLDGYIK